MRAADARLVGLHWRCPDHGVTSDAILLGAVAYCPDHACFLRVVVIPFGRPGKTTPTPDLRIDGVSNRGRSRHTRAILETLGRHGGGLPTGRLLEIVSTTCGAARPRAALARDLWTLRRRGLVRHVRRGVWAIA